MAKPILPRITAGITGSGGAKITPIYKQSIPSATVKVTKPTSDVARNIKNAITAQNLESAKSGNAAKLHIKISDEMNVGKKAPVVKINSGRGIGGGGLNPFKIR
jgi:hypothetical protein